MSRAEESAARATRFRVAWVAGQMTEEEARKAMLHELAVARNAQRDGEPGAEAAAIGYERLCFEIGAIP